MAACASASSSSSAIERKRTDLTLRQKVEIIQLIQEKKLSQTEIAKRFECSQSAVSRIVKHKDEILAEADSNQPRSRKRKRSGKASDVEDALYKWFVDVRSRDAPVTSAVLEEKANHLAGVLGNTEFIATNGWLCRWKLRHGIKFKKLHGEKKDADIDSAEQWSSTVLTQILDRYEPRNVYNADETGIYYRAVPDGTLTFSTDSLSGSKKVKDRVTALVAVNMDGTDKRPLFIVGKSKQPRCFRGVPELPTPYTNSANAWMTASIFRQWLVEFNRDMTKESRNVALVVDNCAAHPKDSADGLSHIALFFLPPNVTSLIQPCDMGIIRNLKAMYRKRIIARIISVIDTGSHMPVSQLIKSISLLDAMHMLKGAWLNVKQTTVVNCFAKAGFVPSPPEEEEEVDEPPAGLTRSEFCSFVDMDSSLECHGLLTDEEICSLVEEPESQTQSGDEEEEGEMTTPARVPRSGEVLQAIGTLRAFLELNKSELTTFYAMEDQVLKLVSSTAKQTSIRDFLALPSPEH